MGARKNPPALTGTDALIEVRRARDALYDYSRAEAGADVPEAVVVAMDVLNRLVERGPTIEPYYVLDAEQVRKLSAWAEQNRTDGCTAWGPPFNGAMEVATQVRAILALTTGNEPPIADGIGSYTRPDLERHARELRDQVLILGRRLAAMNPENAGRHAAPKED